LTEQGVYFVTRLKENADYGVVEKREIPQRRDVLRDEVVFFYKPLSLVFWNCAFYRGYRRVLWKCGL
jgi:hypothetical protein